MFGKTVEEIRDSERALRAEGFCARVAPFDQGENNRVVSWCANALGRCEKH